MNAPDTTPAPRTADQNRAMHALAGSLTKLVAAHPDLEARLPEAVRQLQGADPVGRRWLRAVCRDVSGQDRSSALTDPQAAEVIRRLQASLAALQRHADRAIPAPRAVGTISPAQLEYIESLCEAIARLRGTYSRMTSEPDRWRKWCQHFLGVPWPQTQTDGDTAVEALKSIVSREMPGPAELKRQLYALADVPDALTPWEKRLVSDGLQRGQKWGPLQWAKLHEVWKVRVGGAP